MRVFACLCQCVSVFVLVSVFVSVRVLCAWMRSCVRARASRWERGKGGEGRRGEGKWLPPTVPHVRQNQHLVPNWCTRNNAKNAPIYVLVGVISCWPSTGVLIVAHVAVGQNQWYHFWVGAQPMLVYSGDWDVHWGYDLAFESCPCGRRENKQSVELFDSLWALRPSSRFSGSFSGLSMARSACRASNLWHKLDLTHGKDGSWLGKIFKGQGKGLSLQLGLDYFGSFEGTFCRPCNCTLWFVSLGLMPKLPCTKHLSG